MVISHDALEGFNAGSAVASSSSPSSPPPSSWHHITLALGAGHMPAESLQLPARVADPNDPAQRVVVDPPLVLQGVIKAHR